MFGIGEIHTGVKDRVRECLLPFSSPSVIFPLALKNIIIKIHKTNVTGFCLKHGPNIKGKTWNVY